jgi:RNA polymerase sigma-70 factor (ECF subfamily)
VLSDAEIVKRVRGGDVDAFGLLVKRYERSLLATILAKLEDVHAAEDTAQATAVQAFRRLDTLRDPAKFGPWLMQIARRQTVDALRSQRAAVKISLGDCDTRHVADRPDTDGLAEHEHLVDLVARLPRRDRVLIGLRYFDAHSMAEIATITGRPIGTVTKQISRAVARLRSWWDEENP